MPNIALSTLHLTDRPLAEALATVASLGFDAWELPIRGDGVWTGHLDPGRLVADAAVGAQLAASAAKFPGLRLVGAGFEIAHDAPLAREAAQFEACCALLARLGASVITIFLFDGQPVSSRERHAALRAIAARHRLELLVETHLGTATQDPARAEALMRELELRLTMDFSHYVGQGIEPARFAALLPAVGHVQVRGCGPAVEQPVTGAAGIAALAARVRACTPPGYRGWHAIEYIDRRADWGDSIRAARAAIETGLLAAT